MNRKGFTLIELLAVIVVLGLVLLISVPIISDAYTKSKIKSEEVFVDRLTQAIDSYVKLNRDTMSFSCKSDRCEGRKTENGKEYDISMVFNMLKNSKYVSDCNENTIVIKESDKDNLSNTDKRVITY